MGHEQTFSVQYALTRSEVLRSFLRSLAESPRYRGTIILYSVVVGASTLLIRATPLRSVTVKDAIAALATAAGVLVFIALWVFIRAKTSQRTLTISQDGISTEIGRLKGQIPWNRVKIVKETPQFVLISRTNGNAFFIPHRAFSGIEHQRGFVTALKDWMQAHT
jgi:hypothetical protein